MLTITNTSPKTGKRKKSDSEKGSVSSFENIPLCKKIGQSRFCFFMCISLFFELHWLPDFFVKEFTMFDRIGVFLTNLFRLYTRRYNSTRKSGQSGTKWHINLEKLRCEPGFEPRSSAREVSN